MQHYIDVVQDRSGNVIGGAIVVITDNSTGLPVTVYSDAGGSVVQPTVTTDVNGTFSFYVGNGRYNFLVTKNGATLKVVNDIDIPGDYPAAMLLADAQAGVNTTTQTISASVLNAASQYGAFTLGGTGSVTRTVASKLNDTVSVKDFGAVGNGVTDDTLAIQAAFNSSATLISIPQGVYIISSALNIPAAKTITGDHWLTTEIKTTSASAHVITVAAAGVTVSNLKLTSSIVAASRTGSGLVNTGGSLCDFKYITSNGHQYGFWNKAYGAKFWRCYGGFNNTHGLFLDGSTLAQNEVSAHYSEFDHNTQDGIRASGAGLGITLNHCTCYNNDLTQIHFVGTGGLGDIWINTPEVGGGFGGITFEGTGISDVQIISPFVEQISGAASISLTCTMVTIAGGFIQSQQNASYGGLYIGARDVNISALQISGNAGYGIRLAATSSQVNLSAIEISNRAVTGYTTTTGILIDSGAGAFTASAMDVSGIATPIGGTVPAGSKIRGVRGYHDFNVTVRDTFSFYKQQITLANGLNSNIATLNQTFLNAVGPTLAYSIGGFDNPVDGRMIIYSRSTSTTMTIVNADASTTLGQRILTGTNADVVGVVMAMFIYNSTFSAWQLISHNP